jgi:DNA-binding transcriptional MerR regulator
MEVFTISQLAGAADVNIETVRFYERRGLLRQPPRTSSGYRQYSASDLWRLQFIARAKGLGFTLTEISRILGPDKAGPAEEVLRTARTKIVELQQRQRELALTLSKLRQLVDICQQPDSEDCTALRLAGQGVS